METIKLDSRSSIRHFGGALSSLSPWDRWLHIFWLAGPFVLLIERTPADAWLSFMAIAFIVRCFLLKEFYWIKNFWVCSSFIFLGTCILASLFSPLPGVSFGESLIWFRFPVFAFACCFWLCNDRRIAYAMLVSMALGVVVMCGILCTEFLIEGQKHGRLQWPYGDLVPGSYLAKHGLPIVVIIATLAVTQNRNLSLAAAVLLLGVVSGCLMTGERINSLVLISAACLAVFLSKPYKSMHLLFYGFLAIGITGVVWVDFLDGHSRLVQFVGEIARFRDGAHFSVIVGGFEAFNTAPVFGIGPGNYRYLAPDILPQGAGMRPDNHPHNYFVQILAETGVVGLTAAAVFLGSLIYDAYKRCKKVSNNPILHPLWIVPLALFWPLSTHADFFGQWINVFAWTGTGVAMGTIYSKASA